MKAVFLYNEETTILEVPEYLHHLSRMLNRVATLTLPEMIETFPESIGKLETEEEKEWHSAYDFVGEELGKIFAENQNLDAEKLYIEYGEPSNETEKEFGVLINVIQFE